MYKLMSLSLPLAFALYCYAFLLSAFSRYQHRIGIAAGVIGVHANSKWFHELRRDAGSLVATPA